MGLHLPAAPGVTMISWSRFFARGWGVCPSCATRQMAETAAHLVGYVFPKVPVRRLVAAVPKRLRFFLNRDPAQLNRLIRVVLRASEP